MIKYRFAKGSDNQIIDINDLSRETKNTSKSFYCLGCNNEIIPVLGEKRVKHFRHKHVEQNCSQETYLHHLLKYLFYDVYSKFLESQEPFLIEIDVSNQCTHYQEEFCQACPWGTSRKTFDITKYFKSIALETKLDNFIPDILLKSSNNDYIFVEIAVTHKCDEKKIDSGYRIIEINIETEEESGQILQKYIRESEKNLFYNFKRDNFGDFCKGDCIQKPESTSSIAKYQIFVVYQNGSAILWSRNFDEFQGLKKSKTIAYTKLVPFDFTKEDKREYIKEVYFKELDSAVKMDITIKSCFLCTYNITDHSKSDETIFCGVINSRIEDKVALQCPHFSPKTLS
ncbi:hypothetical protein AWQ22_16165 (plasmid) [Picosynechococcus sp. PCC 7117]|nr:hypothetical protein AWQ22_16165 [Picosynechococcus sp. PCC 7117]